MALTNIHSRHARQFDKNRFVYPVVSRRSGGVSIGVNLNPDKVCNFDCIYCQVDRRSESETRFVETDQLFDELGDLLNLASSGQLFEHPSFQDTPESLRRLNDIAFSGDGEPTTYRNFDELMKLSAELKANRKLDQVKMVLITNASMFHREHVQAGLKTLDENQGEIWAKLDAGTESYFQLIDRTKTPLDRVLDNILLAAKIRPVVIQSLFMRVNGEPPSESEIDAYCRRLSNIVEQGGQISLVQVYTIARRPAESFVTPLADSQVNGIVEQVRSMTGLRSLPFYGVQAIA